MSILNHNGASAPQLLYLAMSVEMKRELKAKKADVMAKLADMPDSQLKACLFSTLITDLNALTVVAMTLESSS